MSSGLNGWRVWLSPVSSNGAVRDRTTSGIHPFTLTTHKKLLTPLLILQTLCSAMLYIEESVSEWECSAPELCQESPVFDLF